MGSQSATIAKNAAVVASATLVSRILGFVRDLTIAFALGAGPLADAFFVAFRIPNLLRRLFGEGSLTMAFIPVFAQARAQQGEERAHRMARSVRIWLVMVLGGMSVVAVAAAHWITLAIAPGFASDPGLLAATTTLVRICFPYAVFICAVALCMGILNASGHFLAPALAPCVLNICLISGALIAVALDADVSLALACSVLVAGLGQWLLQQPFLKRAGFSWKGTWRLGDRFVGRMGKLMLPTVFGAAVYQINILLGTLLASFLAQGSISYLYYADRLVQFPLGVFGIAVSQAALPSLAGLWVGGKREEFSPTLRSAAGLTLFISLPAAAGLIGLAEPIIGLLFGHGAFTAQAVKSTASALVAYGLGLPAIALVRPLVSAFYAMQDTKTPVYVAVFCVALNIGVGVALMFPLAHVGLALAASISGAANALILAVLLKKRLGAWPAEAKSATIFAILSLGVGLAAWASAGFGLFWIASAPVLAGLYFAACLALGCGEARIVADLIKSRGGKHAR